MEFFAFYISKFDVDLEVLYMVMAPYEGLIYIHSSAFALTQP
jgi:hypothetical protein